MAKTSNPQAVAPPVMAPEIRISGWTEPNPAGKNIEKGVTFFWELPAGVKAMLVTVNGASWGKFFDSPRAINVPYSTDPQNRVTRVEFRYFKKRRISTFFVFDPNNQIGLIEDDVPIIRNVGGSTGTICPVGNYPTAMTVIGQATAIKQISYSDRDSSGQYKAVRLTITAADGSFATCIVDPGANPPQFGTRPVDGLVVSDACPVTLRGAFTDQTTPAPVSQRFGQTTLATLPVNVKTYRDAQQDKMIIEVETTHAVQAHLQV